MKFTILAICVAVTAAKPHIYLYNGPSAAPIGRDGRVIDTPEVAFAKTAHLAALASASVKASSAETVETGYLNPIPANTYGVSEPAVGYQGPPAPLAEDGRVIDTADVAQLKAERLSALEKANAEAAAAEAAAAEAAAAEAAAAEAFAAAHVKGHAVYGVPITVAELQEVPTFIMAEPIVSPVQGYKGPLAMIGQDGRVVDTEEVSKLKAEHLAVLAEAQAKAAAFAAASGSSSSSEDYTDEAVAVQHTETVVVPKPLYSGPPAPLGEDGRVIDTEEVAKLKAEHLAALEKANAADIALAAASGAFMSTLSSEGYTYVAPIVHKTYVAPVVHETYVAPVVHTIPIEVIKPQQGYNGPPAPLGEDRRVIDTEEVAKLKAEHLAALDQANAAAAAFAAASGSSMSTFSSEGYTYVAPVVQHTETLAIETPVVQPQQVYNGPPAPLGEDGRVIDTEEVAKLKAEHLAALEKANAAAIALAAESGASMSTLSSEGYTYVAPQVQHTEALAVETPVVKPQQVYNGPPAPLGEDGRVIDTEEVAKLKAEHLAALEKANAAAIALAAASGTSMSTLSSEGYTYVAPQVQHTEALAVETPVVKPQQVYNGPPAPLGEDGRVIDTEEVAKLKAEHLAALEKANAAAIALAAASGTSMSTLSSEGYTYVAPQVQHTEALAIETPVVKPHQVYNGPPAPLGEDGRVIDTEEVARLKAEHLAALEKANAAAIALAAESEASMSTLSSEGYTYVAPQVQHTETLAIETPVVKPQQVYNGPPAPLGEDGRVIDTEEVAKLKAEHLAALEQANAAAAAFAAASGSSMSTISSEGYTYVAPVVHKICTIPVEILKPQQGYNGPLAPLGEDGRVIDTEEVAKLKAEHLAALDQANAAAAAFAAASGSSMSTISSEGYTYVAPVVHETHTNPTEAPVIEPQQVYNGPPAPLGEDGRVIDTEEVAKLKAEHLAALEKANAAAIALAAASGSSMSTFSSEGYNYVAPVVQRTETPAIEAPVAKPHQFYNGPPAPIGEDGRVIDTQEVAKLKNEHLATLSQAHAEASAFAAASSSSSSSATYGAPGVIQTFANAEAHTATKPQETYGGPLAPLSEDGQVVDTDEVARLRAEHLATLAEANAKAEASAATASSSSSAEIVYGAPVVQQIQTFVAAAPIAKPNAYHGPPAPLSEDGRVVDTDEVARLKAERLATLAEATSKAIAEAAAEAAKKPEAVVYSPPLPAVQTLPSFTAQVTEVKPVRTPVGSHAVVQRVVLRRPYTGPLAPLGENGRVVDTEEVAKLKAERLSTLKRAFAHAIKLANAKKTATSSAEIIDSADQDSKETFQGYHY